MLTTEMSDRAAVHRIAKKDRISSTVDGIVEQRISRKTLPSV